MVELVLLGHKPSDLAKEFGCYEISISEWLRQAHADELGDGRPDASLTTAERQELAQLRKQLLQVTMKRDILAQLLQMLGATVVALGCSDQFVPIDTEAVSP